MSDKCNEFHVTSNEDIVLEQANIFSGQIYDCSHLKMTLLFKI